MDIEDYDLQTATEKLFDNINADVEDDELFPYDDKAMAINYCGTFPMLRKHSRCKVDRFCYM